jgi:3-dehydroquinate dehydratase
MVLFSLKFSVYTDNYLGDVAQHIKEIEKIIEESMTRFSINNDGNLISTSKGYGLTYGGILVDSINYTHKTVTMDFVLDVMYTQ